MHYQMKRASTGGKIAHDNRHLIGHADVLNEQVGKVGKDRHWVKLAFGKQF